MQPRLVCKSHWKLQQLRTSYSTHNVAHTHQWTADNAAEAGFQNLPETVLHDPEYRKLVYDESVLLQ